MAWTIVRALLASLLVALVATGPRGGSVAAGDRPTVADGEYLVRPQSGCDSVVADCRRFLSWDRRGADGAVITVEPDDPVVWRFEAVSPGEYRITSRWGCPDDPLCAAPLSWAETAPGRREAILSGGQLPTWGLERLAGGAVRIRSRIGCPDGPACGAALSPIAATVSKSGVTLTDGPDDGWILQPAR